jgi:hypothetical protein
MIFPGCGCRGMSGRSAGGPEAAPQAAGLAAQLPRRIQRRMIDVDQEDRRLERDEKAAREQRHEEACNRALAMAIASAEASGSYPGPVELATVRLPADDKERAERTQAAIQHVLDTQRAQYQRELAWEKEHPAPPAGPPEKMHAFVDEPRLLAPAARSAIGLRIFNRARRFHEAQRAKAAAEAAERRHRDDFPLARPITLRSRPSSVLESRSARAGGPEERRVSYR